MRCGYRRPCRKLKSPSVVWIYAESQEVPTDTLKTLLQLVSREWVGSIVLDDAQSLVFVDGLVVGLKEDKMKADSQVLAGALGGCWNQFCTEKLEKGEIWGDQKSGIQAQTLAL